MTREALLKRLHLAVDLPRYYAKAAAGFGFHPFTGAQRLLRSLAGGYWPSEAYRLGLLHPSLEPHLRRVHVSKRSMVSVQRKLNPHDWENVLSDKSVFYRYCEHAGLPIPRLYGVYARGGGGWNLTTVAARSEEDWMRFLEQDCPSPLIIKPCMGRLGRSIMALTRDTGGFHVQGGGEMTAGEILRWLEADSEFSSFVMQERLFNHPAMKPMAPGDGLTTSRMITLVGKDGQARLLSADLKIVMRDNPTSNLNMGLTGNMAGRVSPDDGRLVSAVKIVEGKGFVEVERHPETGEAFRGFQLPDWESARGLVLRAAKAFLPTRTVGWDVAFTPGGPALIEGNYYFDPPCSTHNARAVLDALLAGMRGGG